MAHINFYPFPTKKHAHIPNKGVACGLNSLLIVKDGPALAGKESAKVAFANVEVPEDDSDGL